MLKAFRFPGFLSTSASLIKSKISSRISSTTRLEAKIGDNPGYFAGVGRIAPFLEDQYHKRVDAGVVGVVVTVTAAGAWLEHSIHLVHRCIIYVLQGGRDGDVGEVE